MGNLAPVALRSSLDMAVVWKRFRIVFQLSNQHSSYFVLRMEDGDIFTLSYRGFSPDLRTQVIFWE